MSLGHEMGNVIEGQNDEGDERHWAEGPKAAVAHPASRADNGALADGRVDHALPTKALQQPFAGLECPAVHAHVFADQHDGRVPLHLFKHGLLDSFEKRDRGSVRRASIGSRHGYLRAFLEAPVGAVFTVFWGVTFAGGFPAGLPAPAGSVSAACVSPKCIGAFAPREPLPDPNPGTVQTASTLDLGAVTSAIGRPPLLRILWQSSPVQYTPVSANSGGGIGEFSANYRSLARTPLIFSSISFVSLASSSFSLVRNFSWSAIGSRASQYARISFGTYSAGSCCVWPIRRKLLASIRIGPSPARARF